MTPKEKAWQWCSKFIRLRDATEYCLKYEINMLPENKVGQCCTCGRIIGWKVGDAGHFISRGSGGSSGVYFDERNIHLQCKTCNGFHQGKTLEYLEFMLKKYGKKVVAELRARDKLIQKQGKLALAAISQYYKDEYNKLLKEGFENI